MRSMVPPTPAQLMLSLRMMHASSAYRHAHACPISFLLHALRRCRLLLAFSFLCLPGCLSRFAHHAGSRNALCIFISISIMCIAMLLGIFIFCRQPLLLAALLMYVYATAVVHV